MTLADLLPAVKQLTAHDKLRLIRLLAEELDTPSDISPFSVKNFQMPFFFPFTNQPSLFSL